MKILIIDTSSERSLITVSEGDSLIFHRYLPFGLQSSSYLLSSLESGFKEVGLSPEHLEAVATTVGPGSFTGLRVGAALAKGIVFPRGLPLIEISSLSAFISPEEGPFVSAMDARIGGVYALFQEREGETIRELSEPQMLSIEEIRDHLVVGPSLQRLDLPRSLELGPDPHHIAKIASQKALADDFVTDLNLVYLREAVST